MAGNQLTVVLRYRGHNIGYFFVQIVQPTFQLPCLTGDIQIHCLEELRGKRKGDILKFNAELPEGFGEKAGREVSFSVLVKEVKAKKLPEADDDFAKLASEFDTLDELRADLRKRLDELHEREADAAVRERAVEAVVEMVDVDLPDRLVDEETDRRVQNAKDRYERLGVSLEEALQQQGLDELQFRSDARAHALRAIKADLALESVARQEEIEWTPEELVAEVEALAQATGRDPKETMKALKQTGQVVSVAGDIIRSKALDLLVENADIVQGSVGPSGAEGEPQVAEPAEASPEGEGS